MHYFKAMALLIGVLLLVSPAWCDEDSQSTRAVDRCEPGVVILPAGALWVSHVISLAECTTADYDAHDATTRAVPVWQVFQALPPLAPPIEPFDPRPPPSPCPRYCKENPDDPVCLHDLCEGGGGSE